MKFAVCVTFQIFPESWNAFTERMKENAAQSLELEPGCLQFDVCTDEKHPYEVFLYEIYEDPDAFELHLQSDHFQRFDRAVADMIKTKTVTTYAKVS